MTDPLMPAGKPDAEVEIDTALVRRLLTDQHNDLATLPIEPLASGWDNVMYRVGDELTIRIPRREIAAGLMVHEQRWLPKLAGQLPIPVPAPVHTGVPTDYYPWHWSLLPWFEGTPADESPPRSDQAGRFVEFLLALHQSAPEEAPKNPVRGVPISKRLENTEERMTRLRSTTELITPLIESVWTSALSAPISQDRRWLHGDLHAQNVLVNDGEFSAIIDWGDITAGDVATDLAGTWALFEDKADRDAILNTYGPDEATLIRAKGWATLFGVVLADSGLINSPRHAVAGTTMLRRIIEDAR